MYVFSRMSKKYREHGEHGERMPIKRVVVRVVVFPISFHISRCAGNKIKSFLKTLQKVVDKGNSFDIIINSTVSSPETIEKVCEITAMPNEYTKVEAFSNLFLHLYEYYEGETLAFSLSQRAGNARATNADDDATFEEIWIKNNKAIFIIYNQTEQTGIFWFDGEYTYLLHSYTGEDIDYLTQLANSVK